MQGALHFVGVYHPAIKADPRYDTMARVFGRPDFVHRRWDRRAHDEVCEGDTVIFADGDTGQPVEVNAYDDSAFQ